MNGAIVDLNRINFVNDFSMTDGKDTNRKVWPVGAVSKITIEKSMFLTNLKNAKINV